MFHFTSTNPAQQTQSTRWITTPPLPVTQRFDLSHLTIPITPPRKAPAPPTYSPRRRRARHIRMKEPAKSGLFTLEEEEFEAMSQEEKKKQKRSSWGWSSAFSFSPSGSEDELATPVHERADPFDMPLDVDMEVDIEVHTPIDSTPYSIFSSPSSQLDTQPTLGSSLSSSSFRPRRPPPLNLSVITDPFALASSEYTPTNAKHHHHLLPALPILSPEEYSATTASSRRLDLDAVFEDLLSTCGESIPAFPMPPPRSPDTPTLQTPTTPPPRRYLQCPGAPGPKDRSTRKLKGLGIALPDVQQSPIMGMRGDHSFLYSLSRESEASPRTASSSSSPSSRESTRSKSKTLPKRSNLPLHWTDNVI